MKYRNVFEVVAGSVTLGLSLYVAFGPLRHRLPKVLTRFAKYSAAIKLMTLSGLCWYALYKNVAHDGSRALRWGATVLGLVLLAAAVYILRRPVVHKAPSAPKQNPGLAPLASVKDVRG